MIQIDPWAYFFAALLMLTLPLDWVLSAVCAAIIHELCHIGAIKILGGRILRICIHTGGAVIESEIPGKREELICALAGLVGSLFLLTLCHVFPKLAICACIQGLFNLIPVYPLDGGRALRCWLELVCPSKSDRIMHRTQLLLGISLLFLAAAGTFVFSMGILPIFMAALLIIKAILRKRPCKQSQIGVQ